MNNVPTLIVPLERGKGMYISERIAQLEREGKVFALVTIIESKGSTPRHVGKMLVFPDGEIEGTIGGGPIEYAAIQEAVTCIEDGRSKMAEYVLDATREDGLAMHCGGKIKVFIEVYKQRPEIVMIGGGHLAMALSKLADFLDYPYRIVDDRPDYNLKERFQGALSIHVADSIDKAIEEVPFHGGSYITIFTKDSDDIALRSVIHEEVAYIGMIGSRLKIKRVFEKLEKEGVPPEGLEKIHTPIGLPIQAETPEEIAVSIIGQIIKESRRAIE